MLKTLAIILAALALQACGTVQIDAAALQATAGSSYGTTHAAARPTMRNPGTPSRAYSR